MSQVLQDLFYGNLHPQDNVTQTRNMFGEDKFTHNKTYFSKILQEQAPALTAKFDAIMNDLTYAYNEDIEDAFCQGFGLAVKLIIEAMSC